jgi:uncharacterized membrane protein YccC
MDVVGDDQSSASMRRRRWWERRQARQRDLVVLVAALLVLTAAGAWSQYQAWRHIAHLERHSAALPLDWRPACDCHEVRNGDNPWR